MLRLTKRGVAIVSGPNPIGDGPWREASGAFLRDPDGIWIELIDFQPSSGGGRLTGLHHVGYTVSDLEAAVALLSGTLGLILSARWDGDGDYLREVGNLEEANYQAAYLVPQDGYGGVELIEFRHTIGDPITIENIAGNTPGSVHGMFIVDDIHETHRNLSSRGHAFTGAPAEITAGVYEGCHAIYFAGPDGIPIELFEGPGHAIAIREST
jgi:catechol 2,3-dioxygenase-like lactoylglutathione lyase family enzyme